MTNSAENPSTLAGQPALAELFAQYLTRAEHGVDGLATGAVEPYDAVALQPVDSAVAWRCARAVLPLDKKELAALEAPPTWMSLVQERESCPAVPLAAGNFPQLMRSLPDLMHASKLRDLVGRPGKASEEMGLRAWADALAKKSWPARLLAAGVLRLARDFERAKVVLGDGTNIPAGDRAAWANEKAALAWQRGDLEEALAQWSAEPAPRAAQFNRGMALLFLDRPAEALAPLRSAVKEMSEDDPWRHLGGLYLTLAEIRA